jgi:hypothetical protein
MKATIESTTKTLVLNGLNLRVWEGVTEKGIRFVALVNRLQSADAEQERLLIGETTAKPPKEPEAATAGALERLGIVTGVPEGYAPKPEPPNSTNA